MRSRAGARHETRGPGGASCQQPRALLRHGTMIRGLRFRHRPIAGRQRLLLRLRCRPRLGLRAAPASALGPIFFTALRRWRPASVGRPRGFGFATPFIHRRRGDALAGLDRLDRFGNGVRGDREADARAPRLRALDARRVAGDLGVDADHFALSLSSGPPELPGFSAASVWIAPVIFAPSGADISRPSAETMPV